MSAVDDRAYWLEMVEIGRESGEKDEQVVEVLESSVRLRVPGFDGQTMHEAFLSLYDYGRMVVIERCRRGDFFVRQIYGYPVLSCNKLQKDKNDGYKYGGSPQLVHTFVCEGLGFRHYRNGNTLDCRRENLATDVPLRTEVPPEIVEKEEPSEELVQQQLAQIHAVMGRSSKGSSNADE